LAGAVAFLDTAGIRGKIFNNYEAGAYLLYREKSVLVDGRNVEYGPDFLRRVFSAGTEAGSFLSLHEQYGFGHAVIFTEHYREVYPLPYASVLDRLPDWQLVYVDDSSAVYALRETNPEITVELGYTHLTPELLRSPLSSIAALPESAYPVLHRELERAAQYAPVSLQIPTAQAALQALEGEFGVAETLLQAVMDHAPYFTGAYNVLAFVRVEQERYADAVKLYKQAIAAGGGPAYVEMDYEYLAGLEAAAKRKNR